MQAIIVTDTHLGIKKSNPIWENVIWNLFVEINKKAKELGIQNFIHLGDFFDTRSSISTPSISMAHRIGEHLESTFDNSYLVTGNHDTYFKDTLKPTSLEIFTRHRHIHTVTEITVVDDITLQPWLVPGKSLGPQETPYLMGHLEMNGVFINRQKTVSTDYKMNIGDLKAYDMVLSGHFHTPGQYGNVHYIGSPYHQDFNDDGRRGFYIWDNGKMEFCPFFDFPKFVTIDVEEDEFDIRAMIEGNMVRLDFKKNRGAQEIQDIISRVYTYNPMQLFTRFLFDTVETTDKDVTVDRTMTPEEILNLYVDNLEVPTNMNPKTLKKLIKSMIEKVQGC